VEAEAAGALVSTADGPDVLLEKSEDGRRVAAALARLAPHLREVVVLKVYHQLKFREIAEITRTPEARSRRASIAPWPPARVARARRRGAP